MTVLRKSVAFSTLAACIAFAAAPAEARGTVVVRNYSGVKSVYDGVAIKVIRGTLFLTTQDGKGTIVVPKAACSYQGKLLVCYVTGLTLIQGGEADALDLQTGTVYLNTTSEAQPLTLSSAKVPANGIMASLRTKRGTYMTLQGQIDEVVQ